MKVALRSRCKGHATREAPRVVECAKALPPIVVAMVSTIPIVAVAPIVAVIPIVAGLPVDDADRPAAKHHARAGVTVVTTVVAVVAAVAAVPRVIPTVVTIPAR